MYVFDVDGTLIKGFLETETCPVCDGEGRVFIKGMLVGGNHFEKCEKCKGKGVKFGKHLPYHHVEVLPGRLEKFAQILTDDPSPAFALATNQGGIAMGYQTVAEVQAKMARVLAAFAFFGGCATSVHIASHHPNARVEGFNDPELCKLRKPLPGMIELAMEVHRDNRADTVFVGDIATDRDCAEAAGVRFEWAEPFFTNMPR